MNNLQAFAILATTTVVMTLAIGIFSAQSVFADRQSGHNTAKNNLVNVQANANLKAQDIANNNDVRACVIVRNC
jgi:hypothetical protein